MDWLALSGVAVPTVLASYAIVTQRRDRKADRADAARAAAEADRRADQAQQASELAAAAAHRAAEASERMAKATEAQAVAAARAAPTPQAAWTLEPSGGSNFLLTNVGNATAYAVHIDLGDAGGAMDNVLDHPILAPGSAVRFLSAPDYETTDDTATVTWAVAPDREPTETWKRPLPPQPAMGGWVMGVG